MKRNFGFDLGIASIGWAVVELADKEYNIDTGEVMDGKLVACGVRCFSPAENEKGESPQKARRDAHSKRKTTKRKALRIQKIRNLFFKKGLTTDNILENAIKNQHGGDIWQLRVKALTEKIDILEFLRILIHMAKHRGFKSTRKAREDEESKDSTSENGKVLKAIQANIKELKDQKSKTIAQIIEERAKENDENNRRNTKRRNGLEKVRNKKGDLVEKQIYNNSIPRYEIERELDIIFNTQKQFGLISEDILKEYKTIAFTQKDTGSVEKMVGKCIFKTDEQRAPKESISSELFVAYSKINNCKLIDKTDEVVIRNFTEDERNKIIDILKTQKNVTYQKIANDVLQNANIQFKDINYSKTKKIINKGKESQREETCNPLNVKFYSMEGYHKLKTALSENFTKHNIETLDKIAKILSVEKTDKTIDAELNKVISDKNDIEKLTTVIMSKFLNLSHAPYMKFSPL